MSHETHNNSTELFKELMNKQRKFLPNDKKLQFTDMKRICKYIKKSIFDSDSCSLWNGYITNNNNDNKGTYINFYFKKKKVALHRLLYINFVDDLDYDEYLKFVCSNKGMCCNVTHLNKFKYQKKFDANIANTSDKKSNLNNTKLSSDLSIDFE